MYKEEIIYNDKYNNIEIYEVLRIQEIYLKSNAIIFIYPSWSSYKSRLKDILDSLVLYKNPVLLIVDIDNADCIFDLANYMKLSNGFIGGWGETFWVKSQIVLAKMGKNYNIDMLPHYNNLVFDIK